MDTLFYKVQQRWFDFWYERPHPHWWVIRHVGGGLAGDGWLEEYCCLCDERINEHEND